MGCLCQCCSPLLIWSVRPLAFEQPPGGRSVDKQIESEVKLVSMAVTQFKFSLIDTAPKIANAVRLLCSLLGITSGATSQLKIYDTYYDDQDRTLAAQGCSIRYRVVEGKMPKVTFKASKKFSASLALDRPQVEFSCTEEEFQRIKSANFVPQLAEAFQGKWCQNAICGSLAKSLTLHNRRTTFWIKTTLGEYEFCFDKFYYESPYGGFSEYFAEIELETKAKPKQHDEQLHKLIEALCEFLDFEPHRASKYERGVNWLRNKQADYKNVHTLTLDIIGYSLRSADIQKQMIQALNRFAKDALRENRPHDSSDIVCIPTGDGMIMVFEQDPSSLVSLVFDLQDRVRKEHNMIAVESRFDFRAGLHTGPVFKYSDINERLNYAGSGINLAQRAMAPGNAWHLLATQEARENVIHSNGRLARVFHKLQGSIRTKHGEELVVYNVYDGEGHGNPEDPLV